MIFVDTSAWYAASSLRDANHQEAKRFLASVRERLVTSDYVVDDSLPPDASVNLDHYLYGTPKRQ